MTASPLRLQTERLTLVPFTAEFIEALPERDRAQQLIGAAIPDGWPDQELAGLLSLYVEWVRTDPSIVGYGPWIVIAKGEGFVVGSAGFIGKPSSDRSIELGFGIHHDFRNRGYASEAARSLMNWGLDKPAVERVVATCDPDNLPSVRVLEKIGMSRVGNVDDQLLWEATASVNH